MQITENYTKSTVSAHALTKTWKCLSVVTQQKNTEDYKLKRVMFSWRHCNNDIQMCDVENRINLHILFTNSALD